MRIGRWTKNIDFGEGSADDSGFPDMPNFYSGNLDFPNIGIGLKSNGMSQIEIDKIMGGNWLRFFDSSFSIS